MQYLNLVTPSSVLKSISFISGELVTKKISKPGETLAYSFACSRNSTTFKYTYNANASATMSRTEFHLGKYAPFVSDEISLNIITEALKE